jgi:cytochrome c-type biogenesis protein CcmF
MNQVGAVGLIAALVFAIYGMITGAIAGKLRSPRMLKSAQRAVLGFFAMATLAVVSLEYLILTNDFHSAYVASHSSRELPLLYKIPVLWSGQEGSLLFWTWLLSIYVAMAVLLNRRKNRQLMPYIISICMGVATFFTLLTFWVANPFNQLSLATATGVTPYTPPDGNGMNPSLQFHSMVAHPPMLYLGYVGMAIPFAFAMSALMTRQLGDNWIRVTRRWVMVPWMFLGTGIVLGGHWAYHVLGWGGYWAWDPVENASLLPWLAGTAFLHSVMIQEKRGMLKVWNMVLIILTFFLSIFGTFLTRSGIISSVHAFAKSDIGPWFSVFLAIIAAFSLTVLFLRLDFLKTENRLDSIASRESGFLFNNWILLAAVLAVLWGTIFPVVSKAIENVTVTVGPPFFNKVMIPIGLLLLFLTGAGPLLAWRKTSFQSIKRNFTVPLIFAAIVGGALFYVGVHQLYTWMSLFLCAFVAASIVGEFYKGARTRMKTSKETFFPAVYNLTMRNTRRYGGYIVHFGIVLMFVGFAGQAFRFETQGLMGPGDLLRAGDYMFRCESIDTGQKANYQYETVSLSVTKDGRALGVMKPQKRFFIAEQEPLSHVALKTNLARDLYVVMAGMDQDSGKAIIHVIINPLVQWVWIGGMIVLLGTILALIPSRIERQMADLHKGQEQVTEAHHVR